FITNSDYVAGKTADTCPAENMRAQADVDVESAAVRDSIRAIAASGTAVVSTLGVYETFMPGRFTPDPRALEMLAPEVRGEVEAAHADLAKSALTVPDRLLAKMMAWERAFVAAGGLLGAGSDPWGTGLLPGYGNLRNIELLVEAGFTFEQAVQISTLNSARILGEHDRIGSIEAGKRADLFIIRGNPVAAPKGLYDVVTVFKDGVGYDSARLRDAAKGKVGSS
ncbi:MAG: amidohydrolase family protein, partial [Acidobacteriota bacterium]|nr:amidohydrolase family protein [Acidobacteriota bacterium]